MNGGHQVDKSTGEVTGRDTAAIRPALETLRELPGVMDKLAVAIHDAMDAVKTHQKPAKVILTVVIEPWTDKSAKLIDEPVMISGDIDTKLPKHEAPKALFYADDDGNPTRQQKRQTDLGLTIAVGSQAAA